MASHFIHISNNIKKHDRYLTTKTLDTNMTSGTGDEKSNITNKIDPENRKKLPYLKNIENFLKRKLILKYNILPYEYNLYQLDNFITGKYCRALASFKEKLMFYYIEEFLKRYYTYQETAKKLPLFYEFYKSYLKFFCSPTLCDLNLNELIENTVEKKAKAFYNENFKEEKPAQKTKTISTIIFSNKIRREISRRNTLTDLSKTTIVNNNLTNKSSITSLGILNLLLTEPSTNKVNNENYKKNNQKIVKENNYNKPNNLNKSSINKINKGVFPQKLKKLLPINTNNNDPLIKVSTKTSSKSKDLSISTSGKLKPNKTLRELKKSSNNINANIKINDKKLIHKKTTLTRNYENYLESKINHTQSNTSNNQLQSFQKQSSSNTPIQGYVTTQNYVKSKTRKILKIPKNHLSNNKIKLIIENENKKIIAYNTNTANNNINLNNNIISNMRDNYNYINNNNKDNFKNLNRNVKLNEKQEKITTSSSNRSKNIRGLKKFSPDKKEGNHTEIVNNNNINNVVSVRKIVKNKANNYQAIHPKNFIINSRMAKKVDKNSFGIVTKSKNNFIK